MNRRQFNQAMVALGSLATLPAAASHSEAATQNEVESEYRLVRIGLICVGGADGNTVASIAQGLRYFTRTIAIDTDAAALYRAGADRVVLIGGGIEKPQHPRQAFEMASRQAHEIEAAIGDLDLVFILAGMYGAAGQGVTPVVADVARRKGIVTLGIAITPTEWQGAQSNPRVRFGVQEFQRAGAPVFPVKSRYLENAHGEWRDDVRQNVRSLFNSISYCVNLGPICNIDLEDVKWVLTLGGIAAMGFGSADGVDRGERATLQAMAHPLLGADRLRTATGVLVFIRGNRNKMTLREVTHTIRNNLPCDPRCIYGFSFDESAGDKVTVSILATLPNAENPPLIT